MKPIRNGSEFETESKKNTTETQRTQSLTNSNSEFSVPLW